MRKRFSAKAAGIIFGLGLGASGMTSQAPVEVFDMHPAFPFPTRPICGGQSAELPRCCWLLGSFLGLRHGMWHHGVISSLLHGGLHGSMLAETFFCTSFGSNFPFLLRVLWHPLPQEAEDAKPRCAESFEKPSKTGDYEALLQQSAVIVSRCCQACSR